MPSAKSETPKRRAPSPTPSTPSLTKKRPATFYGAMKHGAVSVSKGGTFCTLSFLSLSHTSIATKWDDAAVIFFAICREKKKFYSDAKWP